MARSRPAVAVNIASGTGNATPRTENSILYGGFVRESATVAAAASVNIYSGSDNTGDLITRIELSADGFEKFSLPSIGLTCNGIFIERTAGETEITLYCEND